MKVWIKVMLAGGVASSAFAGESDTYVVPVGERSDLLTVNEIAMDKAQFKELIDGAVLLKYKLPELLVGSYQQNLRFIGIPKEVDGEQAIELKGEHGVGKCKMIAEGQFDCLLFYNSKLQIDPEGVKAAIMEISKSELERQLRRDLAEIFSNDPIGIAKGLKLKRRGKSQY